MVLNEFSNDNLLDVLCLGEHWLVKDEIVFERFDDYQIVSSFCRDQHRHGGAAILVHNCIASASVQLDLSFLCSEFNFEVSAIVIENINLVIVVVYRSPVGDPEIFLDRLDDVLNFFGKPKWKKYKVVMGGDVNSDFDVTECHKASVKELLNVLRQFNFVYINSKPTRNTACLDNVFTDIPRENISSMVVSFPHSDHDALLIKLDNLNQDDVRANRKGKLVVSRPVSEDKLFNFRLALFNYNWVDLLISKKSSSADLKFEKFLNSFLYLFELHIPEKQCKVNSVGLRNKNKSVYKGKWYTPHLSAMRNKVMLYTDLFKKYRTDNFKVLYLKYRRDYKAAIIEAKKSYNIKSIDKAKNKCKRAWSVINSVAKINKVETTISPNVFNKFCVESVDEICKSMQKPTETPLKLMELSCIRNICDNFSFKKVSIDIVLGIVKNFKPSASVDIYGISSHLLKSVIDCVIEPLVYLINECLSEGIFPNVLKLSRVVPIYKKGDKSCPSSYRPISLTPIFSKVIETVVYIQIANYLDECNIICREQFGFIKGKSTMNAMDLLVKKIIHVFETKGFSQATFCDLSKAFDCVDHSVMLDKLSYYGIRDKSLELIKSFLEMRQQVVCVGNCRSDKVKLKYGVPQGSVLGPLLFILMINDLPSFLNTQTILYADDTTFFNSSSDFNDLHSMTQDTLTQASLWFRANGFLLNDSKTQQMYFSLRNLPTDNNIRSVKFLGLYLDSKLNWEMHIDFVATKISRVIYLLRNLKLCVSDDYVRSAYFAFFQSIISYGLLLWGNSCHVQRILILQKKAVRIITNAQKLDHCKTLFIKLGCLTVINLYIYTVLIYTKENLNSQLLRQDIHNYNTRNSNKIDIPYQRLSKSLNSYELLGLKMFNKLTPEVTELPNHIFKNKLYSWLLMNPFYSVSEFFECKDVLV